MRIEVKQRDISDCGAACISSLARHYRLKVPVSRIRQYAGTDQHGTSVSGLLQALERLDFEAKGIRTRIESLPHVPMPCIAHVIQEKGIPHFVVIERVRASRVRIMDPSIGQLRYYSLKGFEAQWSGILVVALPSPTFKPRNENELLWIRLWALVDRQKHLVAEAMVGALVYTVLGLSTSIYVQKIVDYVLVDGNENLLNVMSLGMVIILLVQAVLGSVRSQLSLRAGQLIDGYLMIGYFKHLLALPQHFFDTMRVGEILSRFNDAAKIRLLVSDVITGAFVNLLVLAFSFVLMFVYSWKLAIVALGVLPCYALIYVVTNSLNKKWERQGMQESAELGAHVVEAVESMRTIKGFGIENHSLLKMETRFVAVLRTLYGSYQNAIWSGSLTELASKLFVIIVMWVGARSVLRSDLTPGELISFYALLAYFTGPVSSLIGLNKTLQSSLVAADRFYEIMDLEIDRHVQLNDEALSGNIQFNRVTFHYVNRPPVLHDFTLEIPQGHVTAIVGESGSGKSTVISLLLGQHQVQGGQLKVGGFDLKFASRDSIVRWVGVVPQRIDLFSGSLLENIALGEFRADLARATSICDQLGMTEFLDSLPDGLYTHVGENGVALSGGQRQRVAIARLLYKNPSVYIFDEATSSLDVASEERVINTIELLRSLGKTIIIVTHRINSIIGADRVVVLDRGRVEGFGKHEELLRNNGIYQKLWRNQISPETH